jgi:hypothetical protein
VDFVSAAIASLVHDLPERLRCFHILNPRPLPCEELVAVLTEHGHFVRPMSWNEWRIEVRRSLHSSPEALAPLLAVIGDDVDKRVPPTFDATVTIRLLESRGLLCPPADRRLLRRTISFLEQQGAFGHARERA